MIPAGHSRGPATWYYRVVELEDSTWQCRHGLTVFDTHDAFDDAVAHIAEIAAADRPSRVFVHHRGVPAVLVRSFDRL